MIVAERFGWPAVAGPYAMSYPEFRLALLLCAERSFGAPQRSMVRRAVAREDAAFEAGKAASRP